MATPTAAALNYVAASSASARLQRARARFENDETLIELRKGSSSTEMHGARYMSAPEMETALRAAEAERDTLFNALLAFVPDPTTTNTEASSPVTAAAAAAGSPVALAPASVLIPIHQMAELLTNELAAARAETQLICHAVGELRMSPPHGANGVDSSQEGATASSTRFAAHQYPPAVVLSESTVLMANKSFSGSVFNINSNSIATHPVSQPEEVISPASRASVAAIPPANVSPLHPSPASHRRLGDTPSVSSAELSELRAIRMALEGAARSSTHLAATMLTAPPPQLQPLPTLDSQAAAAAAITFHAHTPKKASVLQQQPYGSEDSSQAPITSDEAPAPSRMSPALGGEAPEAPPAPVEEVKAPHSPSEAPSLCSSLIINGGAPLAPSLLTSPSPPSQPLQSGLSFHDAAVGDSAARLASPMSSSEHHYHSLLQAYTSYEEDDSNADETPLQPSDNPIWEPSPMRCEKASRVSHETPPAVNAVMNTSSRRASLTPIGRHGSDAHDSSSFQHSGRRHEVQLSEGDASAADASAGMFLRGVGGAYHSAPRDTSSNDTRDQRSFTPPLPPVYTPLQQRRDSLLYSRGRSPVIEQLLHGEDVDVSGRREGVTEADDGVWRSYSSSYDPRIASTYTWGSSTGNSSRGDGGADVNYHAASGGWGHTRGSSGNGNGDHTGERRPNSSRFDDRWAAAARIGNNSSFSASVSSSSRGSPRTGALNIPPASATAYATSARASTGGGTHFTSTSSTVASTSMSITEAVLRQSVSRSISKAAAASERAYQRAVGSP